MFLDDLLDGDIALELAEAMTPFLFVAELPVIRLPRDVTGVERFEAVEATSIRNARSRKDWPAKNIDCSA